VTFYIQVPDINQHLGTIEQAGGRTVLPHTETDMVTFALFADPEGNVVGLVEGY